MNGRWSFDSTMRFMNLYHSATIDRLVQESMCVGRYIAIKLTQVYQYCIPKEEAE